MQNKTIIETILDCLINKGIDAYPPATKKGICTKEYVVVKASGSSQINSYTSEVHYYDIMCYVPQNKYTSLESFKKEVKEELNKLFPMIIPTGEETPDYYDEEFKAHMVSIMYRNNVRNSYIR